jgi:ankyrin repeat protein
VDSKDNYGLTMLLLVAASGQEAVVKLLLEKAADVDSKDTKSGQMPLSWAARTGTRRW